MSGEVAHLSKQGFEGKLNISLIAFPLSFLSKILAVNRFETATAGNSLLIPTILWLGRIALLFYLFTAKNGMDLNLHQGRQRAGKKEFEGFARSIVFIVFDSITLVRFVEPGLHRLRLKA